jgi:selenocysteine-specific elongation factor
MSSSARFFTVATAGHVDHGKTTLLKSLTGIDTDRLKEEKERQMTTDLGFAHLQLEEDLWIGFIDVPGHGKFLKNMLAGVGGIHLALLVVAADEGPMPQTEQHVRILSILGVPRVVVALTKTDLADAERKDAAKQATEALLFEYEMEGVIAEVDSLSGSGLAELKDAIAAAVLQAPGYDTSSGALLPIDRAFVKTGFGTVITGTLVRGSLKVGDEVFIQPSGIKARLRRLEAFGKTVETAQGGQRLACNLALKENLDVARGMILTSSPVIAAENLLISLRYWAKDADAVDPSKLNGQAVRIYHGTAEVRGHLTWVVEESIGLAVGNVSLEQKLAVEPGDRYILRLSSDAVYGGTVLMKNRPRWMTRAFAVPFARLAMESKYSEALNYYLQAAPNHLLSQKDLLLFVPQTAIETLSNVRTKYGAYMASSEYLAQLQERIELLLKTPSSSDSDGLTLEQVRTTIQANVNRDFFVEFMNSLVANGTIVRAGDRFRSSENREASAKLDDGAVAKLVSELHAHLCIEVQQLSVQLGLPEEKIRTLLKSLSKSGDAFLVNYDYASPKHQLNHAHKVLAQLWTERKDIAPGEFRERLGTSRKYAMALLAHFDDQQITRRLPTGRVLLKPPAS